MARFWNAGLLGLLFLTSLALLTGCPPDRQAPPNTYDGKLPVEIIKCRVTRVEVRANDTIMVTLDRGKQDGVVVQMKFDLVRYGQTHGKMIITEVGKDTSIGKMIQMRGDVVTGDFARSGKRRIRPIP